MAYTHINYMVEGEIIAAVAQKGTSRRPIRYLCRVEWPDGTAGLVPNCEPSTMFGGIDDYLQFRSRTATDDGGNDGQYSKADAIMNASIGDRVYISFINGNVNKPIIMGYAQHPNQTYEYQDEDPQDIDPQMIWKYLGLKVHIDEDGQFTFVHRGAPDISYDPKAETQFGALGAVSGAVGSLLGQNPDAIDLPSLQVTPRDEDEITLMEFLNGGVWRMRDSAGQIIEMDHNKNRIYISNNDLKSTENADSSPLSGGLQLEENATDAEYILLDSDKELVLINARKIIQLYSFDQRKDVTEGDYSSQVLGNVTWEIQGNRTEKVFGTEEKQIMNAKKTTIVGGRKADITGNDELSVTGNKTEDVKGTWDVNALQALQMIGSLGAKLKLANGKVGLGGPTAELLDLIDKELQQLDTLLTAMQAETHIGNLGYPSGPPINAASYAAVQTQLAVIKGLLNSIKGGI